MHAEVRGGCSALILSSYFFRTWSLTEHGFCLVADKSWRLRCPLVCAPCPAQGLKANMAQPLKKGFIYLLYMCFACMSVLYVCSVCRGWKGMSDPLELESQRLVTHHVSPGL